MSSKWNQVDTLPTLEAGEVQLWRIDLPAPPSLSNPYTSLLSPAERLHANRLRSGQTQDHFTVGRSCLRLLLGNAHKIDPLSITISTGIHGKPETPNLDGRAISFNVAHSKDTILIALSTQGAVGVDVEYSDRSTDLMEVAQYNFTEKESSSLAATSGPKARLQLFYRYWTRKEAILKADGRGLLASLASFDVSFESVNRQPIRMRESANDEGRLYFVSDLDLGNQDLGNKAAAAALALESSHCRITQLIFPVDSLRHAVSKVRLP